MSTPTLTQTATIFKLAPTAQTSPTVLVDSVPCAIPASERRGILARFVQLSNEVEQARDEFVQSAAQLAESSGSVASRDAYEEKFETLQRAILRLAQAQQEVIQKYRVTAIRGGVAFYAKE